MLNITDLEFNYGKKQLFKGITLRVEKGGIYGLLGKNGAGKTTLLQLMAGLLAPAKGEIAMLGRFPRRREVEFLEDVFMVSETLYSPNLTADEFKNIYAPFYKKFDETFFKESRREFEIEGGVKINKMSHGQQQKFFLSFALATMCALVILDEPTNGLDIPSKAKFRKLLASSATDIRSFVIATHQVRDLENMIDPIIILDEGRVVFNYSMQELNQCLGVYTTNDINTAVNSLYYEETFGGYKYIAPKADKDESGALDIEFLFNAALSSGGKLSKTMNKEKLNENRI